MLSGRCNKRKAVKLFAQRIDIMFSTYGVDSQGLDLCNCNNIIYFRRHSIIKVNCSVCIMFISRIRGAASIFIIFGLIPDWISLSNRI